MAIKKTIQLLGAFLLLTILTGCPRSEDDCNDLGSIIETPNLIKIVPLQQTYQKGDEVLFKINIPSEFNGINLFDETRDNSPILTSSLFLFEGNHLTFLTGEQGEFLNWFYLSYNSNDESYELEIRIKLNKTGQYSFFSAEQIEFQGESMCNRYRIDTNIEGMNTDNKIEFEVIE